MEGILEEFNDREEEEKEDRGRERRNAEGRIQKNKGTKYIPKKWRNLLTYLLTYSMVQNII
jgi:hypothetical protein